MYIGIAETLTQLFFYTKLCAVASLCVILNKTRNWRACRISDETRTNMLDTVNVSKFEKYGHFFTFTA